MKLKKRTTVITAIIIVGLCFFLCTGLALKKEDADKRVQTFMAGLVSGDVDKTFDAFFEGSRFMSQPDVVQSLKDQTSEAIKTFGSAQGYEFIKEQKYGESVVRLVYILKCPQIPLIWEFYFYKAGTDWDIVTVSANFKGQYGLMGDK